MDEVILLLNKPDVRLKVTVQIEAESDQGFGEATQRAVRENCKQLKFKKGAGFEE